jgi:hypothetical protein
VEFIGIDVHKRESQGCILAAEGTEYFESMVEGMGRTERHQALELYLTVLLARRCGSGFSSAWR